MTKQIGIIVENQDGVQRIFYSFAEAQEQWGDRLNDLRELNQELADKVERDTAGNCGHFIEEVDEGYLETFVW